MEEVAKKGRRRTAVRNTILNAISQVNHRLFNDKGKIQTPEEHIQEETEDDLDQQLLDLIHEHLGTNQPGKYSEENIPNILSQYDSSVKVIQVYFYFHKTK